MPNNNLDRICAKRLKADDFAQDDLDYVPTSKFEIGLISVLAALTLLLLLLACYAYKELFA